ncbi:MAG TPA: RNA 2',3'-cyclic phosphodiesterase [Actinomycetota bacterium]
MASEPVTSESEQRRLFVAVPLPTSVTPAIEAAVGPWRARFPQARWVQPQDRHVTLKFMGPTPRRLDAWLHDRIGEVAASTQAFEIRLTRLGAFPSNRRARVLWVGLEDGAGHLATMAKGLDRGLAPEFAPDRRPFTPHVTVARSDRALELPNDLAGSPLPGPTVAVSEIVLFRSRIGRSSARYEALESYLLRG